MPGEMKELLDWLGLHLDRRSFEHSVVDRDREYWGKRRGVLFPPPNEGFDEYIDGL